MNQMKECYSRNSRWNGGRSALCVRFVKDVFKIFELKGWKVEIMDISQTDHDGVKRLS